MESTFDPQPRSLTRPFSLSKLTANARADTYR